MEEFKELLSFLSLTDIRIMDTHESVLATVEEPKKITLATNQAIDRESPFVDGDGLTYKLKYEFIFNADSVEYFKCAYVVVISFKSQNMERTLELLQNENVKDLFVKKQLNKTLWSILRGTVLDAFNRHSLNPIPLPWII